MLITAIIGALAGALGKAIWDAVLMPWWISLHLDLVAPPEGGHQSYNLRVVNRSGLFMRDCVAYLTLPHDPNHRIEQQFTAPLKPQFSPKDPRTLTEDRLPWALMNSDNKLQVGQDIRPGESQALIVLYRTGAPEWDQVAIPTETGFEPWTRVVLKASPTYKGQLKIVSASAWKSVWNITINATNPIPVTIQRARWLDSSE